MSDISYNPIAAQCTISPCINQVAGYLDHNPVAQLSSCQSLFGFPPAPTVTLPAEDVFSTQTSTYTDVVIVVTTSTAYSTAEETSTAYETLYSTATEYTTTITNTVSTTVAAVSQPSIHKRSRSNKLKRREGCKPKTTTASDEPAAPTATTSDLLSPVPSSCANHKEYSSACACIEPSTVTEYAAAITSVVDEAVTVPVASTQETIVTVGVTTVVVKPATTTLISTLSTETVTTATVTSTIIPAPPVPTAFGLNLVGSGDPPLLLSGPSGTPAYTFATGGEGDLPTALSLPAGGGQLFVQNLPSHKMYIRMSTTSYGAVFFASDSYTATGPWTWTKPTCSVDFDTKAFSCNVQSTTISLVRFIKCGTYLYMTAANILPGGCSVVELKLAP
ncbi:hypothetical protein QBC38DRAFT_544821 [Podospora fimiseda]|uniref:Uncharacterized protein n=1 Tax=Podospora fimiseda TaxID=252190 RepID=A0AAN7BQT1_9PEZI|nr:hypothetical protein QBC38DRAFT_544821 [Podospora fimiseda]